MKKSVLVKVEMVAFLGFMLLLLYLGFSFSQITGIGDWLRCGLICFCAYLFLWITWRLHIYYCDSLFFEVEIAKKNCKYDCFKIKEGFCPNQSTQKPCAGENVKAEK